MKRTESHLTIWVIGARQGRASYFRDFAVRTRNLEDHCVKANPERRTQEQAEENPSGGTTSIINVGIESRRFTARHGCDDTDPEGSLRLSASIRRHRFGCHTTDGATATPRSHEGSLVHAFARGCAQVSVAHRVMARTRVALRVPFEITHCSGRELTLAFERLL